MHRRRFLTLAAAAVAAGGLGGDAARADPARLLARGLGEVLLGPVAPREPATAGQVRTALAAAAADFAGCRYVSLADTLPALITAGESLAADRPGPAAQHALARVYVLASRTLGKLEVSGLHWVAAERAQHCAGHADDPVLLGEARGLVANVARRGGDPAKAQRLTLAAADGLRPDDPAQAETWSRLACMAGYAAAQVGDRERVADLYGDAARVAARVPAPARARATAYVAGHQVSAWLALGDAGTALAHARRIPPHTIPTVERRARLRVDAAQAWAQWGRPRQALEALLSAEREAPGEVRTRGAVRRLVVDLARQPTSLPQLPALARRVHATL